MKKYSILICLLIFSSFGKVFAQTHIYEKFASRDDLEVAYLENIPIDSSVYINATIIIAQDSLTWDGLVKSFSLPSNLHMEEKNADHMMCLRDAQNPELTDHGKILECCLMCVNYLKSTIIICQYSTLEQCKAIIKFTINKSTYEEN